jgi:hypothetical protein
VRVAGVADAVDLFEVHDGSATGAWLARRDAYERALGLYEAGDWAAACRALQPLLTDATEPDGPGLNLMARAEDALRAPPEHFDGTFDLEGK